RRRSARSSTERWCRVFPLRAIRSRSRAARSICRRGAPAGWRAIFSSTSPRRAPRSCRALSPSATSTRTRSPLPRRRPARSPPAPRGLHARLKLAHALLTWAARLPPDARGEAPLVANNPASALALADDLARLMDDMTTRGVAWNRLDGLVPETLDRYWQLTLEFLQIAREAWPQILAEPRAIEPAAPRDA